MTGPRLRVEVDAEIRRSNRVISEIERHIRELAQDEIHEELRGVYRWRRAADRERRNGHILELWQMGVSLQEIAEIVDLTPQRVRQIIWDIR